MKLNQNNNTKVRTDGLKTLLGDPKKAILKLSIPMIIAMSAHTIYNLVDALWVSGIGADIFTTNSVPGIGKEALAAVGFVLPFFMMIISLSTGLGLGGGSAISRRIGAKDKEGADNVAIHTIVITILIAIVFTIVFFFFADSLFLLMGASESLNLAISYGRVIFAGSIVLFFIQVAYAILRSEGDAKRAMYAMLFGAILNIVLDPFFIYTFELGVTGAAYATVISMLITSFILIYWLFLRKDTYVSFNFRFFKFKKDIIKDILTVGLPASIQQLSMSFTMVVIIVLIGFAGGGDNGVAIYNTGWRVVSFAILPLLGIATAVVSVTAAAFGAKDYNKLNTAFMYSIKIGLLIEIIIAITVLILAPFIAIIFTTAPGSFVIQNDLEMFLMITCIFYPGAAFGIASSAMFQGTGKGIYALIATLLRTIVLAIILSIISTFVFKAGIVGIWWSLVIANLIGSIVSFTWSRIYISQLNGENKKKKKGFIFS
jgi:putative MATE family efflux protein